MGIAEISAMIGGAAERLGLMKSGVANLDGRIARLEAERKTADPSRAWSIAQEIRNLTEERMAGAELLNEAERRAAEGQATFRMAEDAAMANLSKISSACTDAARRLDAALREAAGAMTDLEAAASPLDLTLLPSGSLQRRLRMNCVYDAVRAAFAERLSPVESRLERQSMAEQIVLLLGVARENAGRLKRRRQEVA